MRKKSRKNAGVAQPDFQALFFDHFGSRPCRHRYELRFLSSNLYHDLVFLASLLHDARFPRTAVRHRGKKVSILLERDTWEVGPNLANLHYIASRLTIDGVDSLEWRFETPVLPSEDDELWVLDLSLNRLGPEGDHLRFTLVGDGWELDTLISEESAAIVLRDIGTPQSNETARKSGA